MKKDNILFKFFPIPKTLEMPSVGLAIGKDTVKFTELIKGKGGFVLGRHKEIKISEEIIAEKGQKTLKEILKTLKKENNLNFVRLIASEDNSYLFKIRIPKIKKRDIRNSIELQLEEHVPIPASNAIFDYQIVNESNGEKKYIDAVVTVLPKDLITERVNLFKEAGLTVLSIENKAQAVSRSIIPKEEKGAVMIIDSGRTMTGIYIVNNGVVMFTSVVRIGGDILTETIKDSLGLSYKKAEQMKKENGISKKEGNTDLFTILLPIVSNLKDEINKNYIYWHTHEDFGIKKNKERKIKKIILCGGSSNLIGLSEYLSSSMRVEVERANVWVNVNSFEDYIPEIDFKKSLTYPSAIGLSLYNKQ